MDEPQKDFEGHTIITAKVGLHLGFIATNSAVFCRACHKYSHINPNEKRKVNVRNLSNPNKEKKSAMSIMALLTLEIGKGDSLEVEIEGTDSIARDFAGKVINYLSGYSRQNEYFYSSGNLNPER